MTVFAGHNGVIQLKRNSAEQPLTAEVNSADINTTLNRFSFEGADDELLTGDFITISTQDERGIAFLPPSFWGLGDGDTPRQRAGFYINVNAIGGIRVFHELTDAINNIRANEIDLTTFNGEPLSVRVKVQDTSFNTLGKVTGYTLNTERDAIETTTLSDKFKRQYSAGLISGNGSIDVLFGYDTTQQGETPLLMLQLIQRVETGSAFNASLFLVTSDSYGSASNIWYEMMAVVTRSGVEVRADNIISCSIDFVTTGEIDLRIGVAPSYLLQENTDKIELSDFTIDALLKEMDD